MALPLAGAAGAASAPSVELLQAVHALLGDVLLSQGKGKSL